MALIVLDVRTPSEYASGHLQGAVNLDIRSADFHTKLTLLKRTDSYAVYCRGGGRASRARQQMEVLGFSDVTHYSLSGAGLATQLPIITEPGAGPAVSACQLPPAS